MIDSQLASPHLDLKTTIQTLLLHRYDLSPQMLTIARRIVAREDAFVGQDLRLLRASLANRIYTLRRELAQAGKAGREPQTGAMPHG